MSAGWVVFRKELKDALRDRRTWLIVFVSSMIAGALATFLATLSLAPRNSSPADANRVTRLQCVPDKGERLSVPSALGLRPFALSPDGTTLAYVVGSGSSTEIRIRALEAAESSAIPGSEGGVSPFFSPDGKWLAFATTRLFKAPLSGGVPSSVAEARTMRGGVWGDDGWIYWVPDAYQPIFRIPAAGGRPESVTTIRSAEGELQHRWPEILPGGKTLLYTVSRGGEWDDAAIVAERLDGGERRVLVNGGTSPRYLPTGYLVYARADFVAENEDVVREWASLGLRAVIVGLEAPA